MRKKLVGILVGCALCSACLVGFVYAAVTKAVTTYSGYGGFVAANVTTNPVDVRFDAPIRVFSVYNSGASTQVLYVLPNTTVANFLTAVSATNAVPVHGGNGFDFVGGYLATNIVVAARVNDGTISSVAVAGYK